MESAPINTEPSSDLQFAVVEHKPPILPETDVNIAQLTPSKTLAPLTPSSDLTGKRKRLKPQRLEFSLEKKRSRLIKDKDAVHDPSRKRLRKENATIRSKAPVQISQTMIRAREVQSTLGNEYPSFIKTMGLPLPFCKRFLPQHDALIVIEDEDGKQDNLKFIAYRFGLSAGWGKFAVRHKLLEGDVLIFQLVESCKFKVYIVRANNSKDVDGGVKVINQDGHAEHKSPGLSKIINATGATIKKYYKSKGRKCLSSSSPTLTKVKRKYVRSKPPTQLNSHHTDHPVVNSQVQEGPPKPNILLKDVISFKDFSIIVNKQCIDSELSEEIRMDYYNLCAGKNEILHSDVREGLYYKLVAGVIGETVNIANMLRKCKLTTKKEEFAGWDSSLESFELMGMKVGFLRDRVRALTSLAFESEDAKRYAEVKEEQNRNANEIKVLQAKLVELYERNKKLNEVMGGLEEKAERYEIEFQRKVDAPW